MWGEKNQSPLAVSFQFDEARWVNYSRPPAKDRMLISCDLRIVYSVLITGPKVSSATKRRVWIFDEVSLPENSAPPSF